MNISSHELAALLPRLPELLGRGEEINIIVEGLGVARLVLAPVTPAPSTPTDGKEERS